MSYTSAVRAALAAIAMGVAVAAPSLANHNAKRRSMVWRDYAAKVAATHTRKPDGSPNEDPRPDCYLHSHARALRKLERAWKAAVKAA